MRSLLLAAFVVSAALPGIAEAQCIAYEHVGFEGWAHALRANDHSAYLGDDYNDGISSVAVEAHCKLIGYIHRDFKGKSITFESGSHPNMPDLWNDEISSAVCRCNV